MDIFRIAAVGIISAMIAVTVKKWRPEFAAAIGIAAGVGILFFMADSLKSVISGFEEIIERSGISPDFIRTVIKLTGIAYITKFATEVCRDSGENAIAAKVELAGKIAVLVITLPILSSFLNLITETLNSF